MERRDCQDGSSTFYNKEFDECYHSPVGAALEAREKYAKPCEVAKRCEKGKLRVLDVCFGFGYNTAAVLELVSEDCVVEVVGLENDKEIFPASLELPFPFENKDVFENWATQWNEKEQMYTWEDKEKKWSLKLLIGDALVRIDDEKVGEGYDVVLFDPFSPKKNPELWTPEFFSKIYARCAKGAVLATYSCARAVRDAMRESGFEVKDGPVVGRRGPATLAFKK